MDGKWMAKMASVTPGIVGKIFTKKKKKKERKKNAFRIRFSDLGELWDKQLN